MSHIARIIRQKIALILRKLSCLIDEHWWYFDYECAHCGSYKKEAEQE